MKRGLVECLDNIPGHAPNTETEIHAGSIAQSKGAIVRLHPSVIPLNLFCFDHFRTNDHQILRLCRNVGTWKKPNLIKTQKKVEYAVPP